jgi:hypothetical protein
MQGGSVEARTQGVGEGVADASARVEQRVRGRAEQCAAKARQGRSEHVTNNGRRRKSYAGQRRAERRRAAHDGVFAGRAQAATELMCRRVARDGH